MKKRKGNRWKLPKGFLDPWAEHLIGNEEEIRRSHQCGCLCCGEIFKAKEIYDWTTERDGRNTAYCPCCGVDMVIGDGCGVEITPQLLKRMM